MLSFYELSPSLRLILQILLSFSVAAELLQVILLFLRRRERTKIFRALFESGLIYQLLILNLCLGVIQINAPKNLFLVPYPLLRLFGIAVPPLVLPLLMLDHRSSDLLTAVFSFLLLPFMEGLFQNQYAAFCIAAILFFFLRALIQLILNFREIRYGLSRFAMKEAFDRFPYGLAIGRRHRGVLLLNKKMREIMKEKGLPDDRRSSGLRRSFRRMLKRESLLAREKAEEKQPNLSLLTLEILSRGKTGKRGEDRRSSLKSFQVGDKTYRYTEEDFNIGKRAYRQMLVSDISREKELLLEIGNKNQELEAGNAQMEDMLRNIEEIEMDKESTRMRNRIHDVMGQRLSILHSTLQQLEQKKKPQVDELLLLLNDLLDDLREPERLDPELRLRHIRRAAEIVGTKLETEGAPPREQKTASVFLQVLREAVTNAIRHGQAKNVRVVFREEAEAWTMEIENDGAVPRQQLAEGEGITGMRRKLSEQGGGLEISADGLFRLKAGLPKNFGA